MTSLTLTSLSSNFQENDTRDFLFQTSFSIALRGSDDDEKHLSQNRCSVNGRCPEYGILLVGRGRPPPWPPGFSQFLWWMMPGKGIPQWFCVGNGRSQDIWEHSRGRTLTSEIRLFSKEVGKGSCLIPGRKAEVTLGKAWVLGEDSGFVPEAPKH